MGVTNEQLKKLFSEMPYKWRVQSTKFGKSTCVAYVDSRQVQDKLDEVCGQGNWQDEYRVIKDQMFAGIGILITDDTGNERWVWKWDTGSEANMEAEKSIVSDSFKRSAVKWGIGRFLYSLGMKVLNAKTHTNNKEYPTDDKGNILWTADDLNNYLNGIKKPIKEKAGQEQPKKEQQLQPSQEFNKPSVDTSKIEKAFEKFSYLTQVLPELKSIRETKDEWKTVTLAADIKTFATGTPKELIQAIHTKLTGK